MGRARAMLDLLVIFASAASTTGAVLILNVFGIVLAKVNLLDRKILKKMSALSSKVFLPSLIFIGLSKGLTLEKLRMAGPLPFFAILHICVAFIVGYVARFLVKPSKQFSTPFLCACSFHNSSALPLVITTALATQAPFSKDRLAFEKMSAYIFIYVVGWGVMFWVFGYSSLMSAAAEKGGSQRSRRAEACEAFRRGFLNPPMIMTALGIIVGCVPFLKALFHAETGAPLSAVSSAVLVISQPATGIVTLVIAGTLGCAVLEKVSERRHKDTQVMSAYEPEGQNGKKWPVRVLLWLCFVKLVVIGGIQFSITAWLMPLVFPAGVDPLLKIVLLIESSALPSANLNLVICQQAGNLEAAETLSLAYILMYIGMLLTLVIYLMIAMSIVY